MLQPVCFECGQRGKLCQCRYGPEHSEKETQYQRRIRIEVSTSVKGVHTYSCTVELVDQDLTTVVAESDKLVALLDARYSAKE